MPKDMTSPFSPGRPVPVEFFVGRLSEVESLSRRVRDSAAAQRLEVAYVSGERGIGKSSLAAFVRRHCEKEFRVFGVHALMGGTRTVEEAVGRVFAQMLKDSIDQGPLFTRILKLFSKHVRQVGLLGIGIEFNPDQKELRTLAGNFSTALRSLYEKLKGERKGIMLIIDDINGLAESTEFANWFKSLVDEMSTARTSLPLCIMLVSLEERRRSLVERQPSLARVFHLVHIRTWSQEESRSFFEQAFSKARVRCERPALDAMVFYSGGLPVLAHEIGEAAFQADDDFVIDEQDAMDGVIAAADVVGRKYLNPVVYRSLRSPKYRAIPRKLARGFPHETIARSDVRKLLTDEENRVFDNWVRKTKRLGVLLDEPESGRGFYRFGTRPHYLYFAMEARNVERDRMK